MIPPPPSLAVNRRTIVSPNARRAALDARMYYGAVAVTHVSKPSPSRTITPQFVVTFLTVETDPDHPTGWCGGDVVVDDSLDPHPQFVWKERGVG